MCSCFKCRNLKEPVTSKLSGARAHLVWKLGKSILFTYHLRLVCFLCFVVVVVVVVVVVDVVVVVVVWHGAGRDGAWYSDTASLPSVVKRSLRFIVFTPSSPISSTPISTFLSLA